MNYYTIIQKLIGRIEPVGESHTDANRFENLKEHAHLTELMVDDLRRVANYKDRHEASMSKAGKYAAEILAGIKAEL